MDDQDRGAEHLGAFEFPGDASTRIRSPGRRTVRDDIASGVRMLVLARPSARHVQPPPVPFVAPERFRAAGGSELLRAYFRRVAIARDAHESALAKAQRAERAKGFTWGGNARRVNPIVRSPYPPHDELEESLAVIRARQRNERKRGKIPGATLSGTGVGYAPSGTTLEKRRAAYLAKVELRKIARRVKRHGGPFSKASRAIVARLQSERAVDEFKKAGK